MGRMTEKKKRTASILSISALLFFFVGIAVFLGKPLLSLFEDPEVFRAWVEEKGWGARFLFVGMVVVQVVVALIPGEPLEIAAGLAFGSVEGTILALCGIFIGSALVFLFVRIFGVKLVEVFFPLEKIRSLRFLQNTRRVDIILFYLMLLPGTPKDLISYFVGLTEMKLGHWLLLTTVARIPSVITSTIGGNALGEENYVFAAVVFALSVVISLVGIFVYDRVVSQRKKRNF